MNTTLRTDTTYIVDLDMLNTHNSEGCASCKQKFNLGDTVVMACGPWPGNCTRLIHENEAVFDKTTHTYFERRHYHSLKTATVH